MCLGHGSTPSQAVDSFPLVFISYLCRASKSAFAVVVQLLSHARLFVNPWTAAYHASLSVTICRSSHKLMSIESVMPSNHLILCHPLLLPSSVFPSIRVFPNESAPRLRWPKYWSFGFSICPSNEYSGLISFRIDWFDLPAVPSTLKSECLGPSQVFAKFMHCLA